MDGKMIGPGPYRATKLVRTIFETLSVHSFTFNASRELIWCLFKQFGQINITIILKHAHK